MSGDDVGSRSLGCDVSSPRKTNRDVHVRFDADVFNSSSSGSDRSNSYDSVSSSESWTKAKLQSRSTGWFSSRSKSYDNGVLNRGLSSRSIRSKEGENTPKRKSAIFGYKKSTSDVKEGSNFRRRISMSPMLKRHDDDMLTGTPVGKRASMAFISSHGAPRRLQSVLLEGFPQWEDADVHLSRLVPVDEAECHGHVRHFSSFYYMERILGAGAFGEVWLVKDRFTGIRRACKFIPKTMNPDLDDTIMMEVKVLRELDHPNILRVLDFFEDRKYFYLVTDFLPDGELFEEILRKGRLKPARVAHYMHQLLGGLSYIHSKGVVHRDLKCENLLLDKRSIEKRKGAYPNVKIIDFGLSYNIETEGVRNTKVGTYMYMSPEVITRNHPNSACDVWSAGVMMFMMLCGYPPFRSRKKHSLLAKILAHKVDTNSKQYFAIDERGKDLLRLMMMAEAPFRISARDATRHEWIRSYHTPVPVDRTFVEETIRNMRAFRKSHQLKQAALYYMGCKLTDPDETKALTDVFFFIDKDNMGRLGTDQFLDAINQMEARARTDTLDRNEEVTPVPEGNNRLIADKMLQQCDFGSDGYLDYSEFITVSMNRDLLVTEEKAKMTFKQLLWLKDEHDTFDFDHLQKVLGGDENENRKIFNEVDVNKDGFVDFEEFKNCLRCNDVM